MKFVRVFSIMIASVLCLSAYAAPPAGDPGFTKLQKMAKQKKGFHPVFEKDLSNATFTKGMWAFEGEVLGVSQEAAASLAKKAKAEGKKGMRDLWSKASYGDFILDLEFKCEEKTNSGVFLRTADIVQWLHTGIEIQIYQPNTSKSNRNANAAVYDCQGPTKNMLKEVGEWNRYTIICNDNWIHIILNGEHVVEMDLDRWTQAHKNPDGSKNKFNTAYKDMAREGVVGLQYHGAPVWFRNLRIKSLD